MYLLFIKLELFPSAAVACIELCRLTKQSAITRHATEVPQVLHYIIGLAGPSGQTGGKHNRPSNKSSKLRILSRRWIMESKQNLKQKAEFFFKQSPRKVAAGGASSVGRECRAGLVTLAAQPR